MAKIIKCYDETNFNEDHHRKDRPRVTSAAQGKYISVTSFRNFVRAIHVSNPAEEPEETVELRWCWNNVSRRGECDSFFILTKSWPVQKISENRFKKKQLTSAQCTWELLGKTVWKSILVGYLKKLTERMLSMPH